MGLRNQECVNLCIQDVDFKANIIHIKEHGDGEHIKNGHERDVVMTKQVANALDEWLAHRKSLNINHDYLFFTEDGIPFAGRKV